MFGRICNNDLDFNDHLVNNFHTKEGTAFINY